MTDSRKPASLHTCGWWAVLCLVGLDYFSTLAYLPSIAVTDIRALAPLAACGVVAVTLFAALPVYLYVVGRSADGRGATGLLERNVHGWRGKLLILVLLGFVATDFVITRTLSVSDASTHILANPFWQQHSQWVTENREVVRGWFPGALQGRFFDFWSEQLLLTLLLTILAFGLYFYLARGLSRGFLRTAVVVVVLYLGLTAVVVGSGLNYLNGHPEQIAEWRGQVERQWASSAPSASFGLWALLGLLAFPPLALGLSGFELSLTSVPLLRTSPGDTPQHPRGRIRRARLLMLVAALIMSVFVLGSVFSVTLLVPEGAFGPGGAARNRALAYLAHGGAVVGGTALNPIFGDWFGSLYDLSSVLILCLAGASATISLRDLVPEYLSRFGMQMEWAHRVGVILHLFNLVTLLLTVAFRASVSAQQWAYATSVLALLLAAAVAAVLDLRHRLRGVTLGWLAQVPFALVAGLFLVMGVLLVISHQSGLLIALAFVAVVLVTAFVSRYLRATELRFEGFVFPDEATRARWEEICRLNFQVLVPHDPSHLSLAEKDREIRKRHRLGPDVFIIFIEATVGDPSDFYATPLMEIVEQDGREVIRVCRCNSIAHVIAAIGLAFREVGDPPEVHFTWSDQSPISANIHFLLWGQGNIPWLVRDLVRKAEPNPARRPRVVIG
jgi:hypothetical protein